MAPGFCEDCSRLLKEFSAYLRKVCREFGQKVRNVFRELCRCTCFRITPERSLLTEDSTSLHLLCGRCTSFLPDSGVVMDRRHTETRSVCFTAATKLPSWHIHVMLCNLFVYLISKIKVTSTVLLLLSWKYGSSCQPKRKTYNERLDSKKNQNIPIT